MKRTILATAFVTWTSLAATGAQAEISVQGVYDSFTAAGYSNIQVYEAGTTLRAEATRNGDRVEVVYDRATGAVLSQEVSGRDGDGPRSGGQGGNGARANDDNGSDDNGSDSDSDSGSDDNGSDSDSDSDSDGGSDDNGSDSDSDSGSDGGSDDNGSDSDSDSGSDED